VETPRLTPSLSPVTTLLLPYHQDERVSDRSIVLPDPAAATLVAPQLPEASHWQRLVTLYDALAAGVADAVAEAGRTTVVSGDCLAFLGTLAGAQRANLDPAVVWFDAHGDVHTLASSTSGYLGGMALRMALGGDAELISDPLGLRPLPESRAVLVDARDLDPAEVDYLATSEVTHTQVDQIRADDLPEGPVIVHVDLDVIDASELPGLRFPVPGGPTTGAVLAALDRLLASGRVAILDIACPWFEPDDDEQVHRRSALLAGVIDRPGPD
jgi:arginase